MIVEETIRKGNTLVSRRMNELGLKLRQIQIVDLHPDWCLVFYDSDDVIPNPATTPFHRGPGRPPNPSKEAA